MKSIMILMLSFFVSLSSMADIGFRFNPIVALVGMADASLDLPLGNSFRISPTVLYWNLTLDDSITNESSSFTINGTGVDLTYHFDNNFSDGMYLGGYYSMVKFEYESVALNTTGELETTVAGAMLGYQWCWTSFYMNLAAKFGSTTGATKVTVKNKTTGVETGDEEDLPASGGGFEFKLGWRF